MLFLKAFFRHHCIILDFPKPWGLAEFLGLNFRKYWGFFLNSYAEGFSAQNEQRSALRKLFDQMPKKTACTHGYKKVTSQQ